MKFEPVDAGRDLHVQRGRRRGRPALGLDMPAFFDEIADGRWKALHRDRQRPSFRVEIPRPMEAELVKPVQRWRSMAWLRRIMRRRSGS